MSAIMHINRMNCIYLGSEKQRTFEQTHWSLKEDFTWRVTLQRLHFLHGRLNEDYWREPALHSKVSSSKIAVFFLQTFNTPAVSYLFCYLLIPPTRASMSTYSSNTGRKNKGNRYDFFSAKIFYNSIFTIYIESPKWYL